MDADEMLASALQEEEVAAARQQQGQQVQGGQGDKDAMLGEIRAGLNKAQSVEDLAAQAAALSLMPLELLRAQAADTAALNRQLGEALGGAGAVGEDDLLVQGLLHWFKHDFFSWVDQPRCDVCGGPTSLVGMAAPTPAEARHGAGRVEAYRCSVCQQMTRFPRYTDPKKLLETRRGRCGEWAHIFLLCLRAAGFDARHVSDSADHVWCEYWSGSSRWVHVDACEESWDKPLLYEGGWGKQLAYVFGASRHGVADVTRLYVVQPRTLPSRRTRVPETWLASTLAGLTTPLRSHLDSNTRRQLAMRDASEALQLMNLEDGQAAAGAANLPGRQSGAEAWRTARGESGASQVAAGGGPATPYRHAPDTDLPALFASAGRLVGGVCRASGEHAGGQPSQQVGRLFDGSLGSKWLDFGGGGTAGSAWAEYRLLPSQTAVVVTHYDLVSAEDCPERDPCVWVLECIPAQPAATASSNPADVADGSSSRGWVVLDRQSDQQFSRRHQLHSYIVPGAARVASRQWRLRIACTTNPAAANSVQLACWNIYSSTNLGSAYQEAQQQQQQVEKHEQLMVLSAASPPSPAAHRLMYMDLNMWRSLQGMFAGGPASDSQGVPGEVLGTLQRILNNMEQHPDTPKFWQLSASAAKLQPVLQNPLLLAALFEAGFRPVMEVQGDQAVDSKQLRLLADEGSEAHAAIVSLLKA